jgi:hypothetical protein
VHMAQIVIFFPIFLGRFSRVLLYLCPQGPDYSTVPFQVAATLGIGRVPHDLEWARFAPWTSAFQSVALRIEPPGFVVFVCTSHIMGWSSTCLNEVLLISCTSKIIRTFVFCVLGHGFEPRGYLSAFRRANQLTTPQV